MYFCGANCNVHSFIYDFIYLNLLFSESSKMFDSFVYLFKETAVSFIDLFCCFLCSLSIISALIFVIFFLVLSSYLVCSFLIPQTAQSGILFAIFLFSLNANSFCCLFMATVFPISTTFAAFDKFWYIVYLFSLVFRLNVFLLISFLTHRCSSVCLIFTHFWAFQFSFCDWFLALNNHSQKKK